MEYHQDNCKIPLDKNEANKSTINKKTIKPNARKTMETNVNQKIESNMSNKIEQTASKKREIARNYTTVNHPFKSYLKNVPIP